MFFGFLFFILAAAIYLYVHNWIHVSRLSPKKIQKLLVEISKHISFGEWEEAQQVLKPLLEYRKGNKYISLSEIHVLQGTKQYEEALEKILHSAREFPEELLFRVEEGKVLLKLDKPKEALEAFGVCHPILRSESDICLLAEAYFRNGQKERCLELLEPFLKSTQSEHVMALAADAYASLKQFKEAISLYQKCIELGYSTSSIFAGLATSLRRVGNLQEAEKLFRKLLEKNPEDPDLILGLGSCFQERGHFQKALLIYQSSAVWETKNLKLLKEAALCAVYVKKFTLAEVLFFEIIHKENPSLETLSYYGYALESQRKWQEAEQVYLRMIQLFPSSPQGFRALSWLFGVGLSTTLTIKQGLNFAHIALKLKNDLVSWEILSACEARANNFDRAYQIQQSLAQFDEDKESKIRRQSALRSLRKQEPLGDSHVQKTLVA